MTDKQLNPGALYTFYADHLTRNILPFWLERSLDKTYGGFYTCFDNSGKTLLSQDKYTWSQGRMIWVFSKLAAMEGLFDAAQREAFLKLARGGAEFLMAHGMLPEGGLAFLLSREGVPYRQADGSIDTSLYADCFGLLGVSAYGLASGDSRCLDFLRPLFSSVLQQVKTGNMNTAPYPIPEGYRMHGIPMILLNTAQELSWYFKAAGDPLYETAAQTARDCMRDILENFVDAKGVLHEMIRPGITPDENALFDRYINPGHTIEDVWFIIHAAREYGDPAATSKAVSIAGHALSLGWDEAFGGLFLFADKDGGPPRGDTAAFGGHPMAKKIQNDWDSKLWWVHSEALYTTLLGYRLTGDRALLDWYRKAHDYAFATFPNPDASVGEWIQIRDRRGAPQEKTVALSVKDPFHIMRNIILILRLLREWA